MATLTWIKKRKGWLFKPQFTEEVTKFNMFNFIPQISANKLHAMFVFCIKGMYDADLYTEYIYFHSINRVKSWDLMIDYMNGKEWVNILAIRYALRDLTTTQFIERLPKFVENELYPNQVYRAVIYYLLSHNINSRALVKAIYPYKCVLKPEIELFSCLWKAFKKNNLLMLKYMHAVHLKDFSASYREEPWLCYSETVKAWGYVEQDNRKKDFYFRELVYGK